MNPKDTTSESQKWILAIDPGSDKVGYAVVNYDFSHGDMGVVYLSEIHNIFEKYCRNNGPSAVIVGNGTAASVLCRLYNDMEINIPVRFADEKNTTFKARARYFAEHPPKGFWRIVPLGMQTPSVPIDDYAAWLIGERYLKDQKLVDEKITKP